MNAVKLQDPWSKHKNQLCVCQQWAIWKWNWEKVLLRRTSGKKDKVVKNKCNQGNECLSIEIYESQIAERT